MNITGVFLCSQAFLRHLTGHGKGGAIVNLASTLGVTAAPNRAAYTASKHAVVGLTKEEAEAKGLTVKVGRIPMKINARYLAENPDEGGLCKVVLDADTRRLLGVHMVGGACSEMIFGATAMLETELREDEIEEIKSG